MPIVVKGDDVRSGRKAKARHGRLGGHGSQWVNVYYFRKTKLHRPRVEDEQHFFIVLCST